jgi:hypothetical protein
MDSKCGVLFSAVLPGGSFRRIPAPLMGDPLHSINPSRAMYDAELCANSASIEIACRN